MMAGAALPTHACMHMLALYMYMCTYASVDASTRTRRWTAAYDQDLVLVHVIITYTPCL